GRPRSLRYFLVALIICRQTDLGDFHGPTWRPGLLWRTNRRFAGICPLFFERQAAVLERRGHSGPKRCTRPCAWPNRLFAQWLLLRARVRSALGDHLSSRSSGRSNGCASAPDTNL